MMRYFLVGEVLGLMVAGTALIVFIIGAVIFGMVI